MNCTRKFLKECRFERPTARHKLLTFKDEGLKGQKKNWQQQKITELRCTRDLMGRFLVLAMKKDMDLEHVMSYPLMTVPLSLCSTDGMMVQTDKSVLLTVLAEKKVE